MDRDALQTIWNWPCSYWKAASTLVFARACFSGTCALIGRSHDRLVNAPDGAGSLDPIELLDDRVDDAGIHRLDLGREHGREMAVAPDQVFVEVPARRLDRALDRGPSVERMRILAPDLLFGGEREGDAIVVMR